MSGRVERRHGAPPASPLLSLGIGFAVVLFLLLIDALIVVSLGGAK